MGSSTSEAKAVSRGYLNDPAQTALKFLPGIWSEQSGARVYRTGDKVRYDAAGEIEYIGRVDQQVKIRGYRIEPGEIEAVLTQHDEVKQCAVVVREEDGRGKQLVCYYVGVEGEPVSGKELKKHISERLPEYMVPSLFVHMEKLPLTPNGKLDRKALPSPTVDESQREKTEAGSPVEEIISGIWSEVLRVPEVGVEENFFELGGHSLLATQVISRIREVLEVEVPLRAVFEQPTVRGLAEAVQDQQSGLTAVAPPIERASREADLPLSFAQQRLWFIHQLEPGEQRLTTSPSR